MAKSENIFVSDNSELTDEQWLELVWNCSFNALSVLEKKVPGELVADLRCRAVLVRLMAEVIKTGSREGVTFPDNLINRYLKTALGILAIPTMLQAFENDEIVDFENVNGCLLKRAEKNNLSVPENQRLYNALKELSLNK